MRPLIPEDMQRLTASDLLGSNLSLSNECFRVLPGIRQHFVPEFYSPAYPCLAGFEHFSIQPDPIQFPIR